MKKMRMLALLTAITMLFACVAGCAGSNDQSEGTTKASEVDSSQTSEDNESSSETTEEKEPVTLRFSWWGGDERNEATLKVIENFETEYPWITIEPEFGGDQGYLEKLSTSLAGGQAADIIQNGPGWMPGFMDKGDFFIDFNEYKDYIDLSSFSEEYLNNTSVYNNKLVGLPSGVSTTAMLVNKTLADKIGLDFSKPVTWEGMIEMGQKVQDYDKNMYLLNVDTSFTVTNVFRPYIMQLTGSPLIDDDSKALASSSEQLNQVLSYVNELYSSKATEAAGEKASFEGAPQTNPKWINGEYVCVMTNSSQINNLTGVNPDDEYIVVAMPVMADSAAQKNDGYYANPPQLMCVNKASEHIEESVMFMDYFFNNEEAAVILKDLRSVPPTERARKICEEQGLVNPLVTEAVNLAIDRNGINEMGLTTDSEVEAAMKMMIESVSFGESTPEEATEDGIQIIENILAEK